MKYRAESAERNPLPLLWNSSI